MGLALTPFLIMGLALTPCLFLGLALYPISAVSGFMLEHLNIFIKKKYQIHRGDLCCTIEYYCEAGV
jgi:hypothetical protein